MRRSTHQMSDEIVEQLRAGFQANCAEAAQRIADADILLLCTGAGFSADSGLATYADVAKVGAYAERGLKYHDICTPGWLRQEPDLFWGFWGQCFNDYRSTAPHVGYEIVNSWVEKCFRNSTVAERLRQRLPSAGWPKEESEEKRALLPYSVKTTPGAFFAFTSNVDAHHFDWFDASEIHECHGNTEMYQCTSEWMCDEYGRMIRRDGCNAIWRAPADFHFRVDKTTMLAADSAIASGEGPLDDTSCDAEKVTEDSCPRVGHVRGGGRPHALRNMPPATPPTASFDPFARNHPVCPWCGKPARPAILMFGDWAWTELQEQADRWNAWYKAVRQEIELSDGPVRVVILELGAGDNVPTVRCTSEGALTLFSSDGADACLIRVNPELPFGDRSNTRAGGQLEKSVISIMSKGVDALRQINASLPDHLRFCEEQSSGATS